MPQLNVCHIIGLCRMITLDNTDKFYSQPMAHRFGNSLIKMLQDEQWSSLEIAVAWVRHSGMRHILPALEEFVKRGNTFHASVGIDIEHTSREGLEDLLSLSSFGVAETYIFHNEARGVFHPKVYLFSNSEKAKLIVGSNNLTEDGLFINTEAGLEITAQIDDMVIKEVKEALASWRDTSYKISHTLDHDFLEELVLEGYVYTEAILRGRSRLQRREQQNGKQNRQLFGRMPAPLPPPLVSATTSSSQGEKVLVPNRANEFVSLDGRVLLMRIRVSRGGTQAQVPQKLLDDSFFFGVISGTVKIVSLHDLRSRSVNPARSGGTTNTRKLEIPEAISFSGTVLRLVRTTEGILYQAFDIASPTGAEIMRKIDEGYASIPRETGVTRHDLNQATMWRFV